MKLSFLFFCLCLGYCAGERIWSIGGATGSFAPFGLNTVDVSNVSAANPSWASYAAMNYERFEHAVVADGSKIYAIGGRTYRVSFDESEVIDTQTAQPMWAMLPKMTTPRANLAAVNINGTIYAIGGDQDRGGKLRSTETFDTRGSNSSWTPSATMSWARAPALAVAVGSTIYAMGGYDDNAGFIPTIETLETTPHCPPQWNLVPNIANTKLITQLAAVGTTIYAMHNDTTVSMMDTTVDLAWKPFPARMLSSRCFHGVATLGQKIFAIGGADCSAGFPYPVLRTVEVLDLSHPRPFWQHYANLTNDRSSFAAVGI